MNRVRHEFEIKLKAEKEAGDKLKQTLEEKMAVITEKQYRIEYFEQELRDKVDKAEELKGQVAH